MASLLPFAVCIHKMAGNSCRSAADALKSQSWGHAAWTGGRAHLDDTHAGELRDAGLEVWQGRPLWSLIVVPVHAMCQRVGAARGRRSTVMTLSWQVLKNALLGHSEPSGRELPIAHGKGAHQACQAASLRTTLSGRSRRASMALRATISSHTVSGIQSCAACLTSCCIKHDIPVAKGTAAGSMRMPWATEGQHQG